MCRYKSEGDPNGRSDCDSLRDDNEIVHGINEKLREEIRKLRKERQGFLTPDEVTGLMRVGGFLVLNNAQEGASIVRGILERHLTNPALMMSSLPPGPEGDA